MKTFKNVIAFVSAKARDGVFASFWQGKQEVKIFIATMFSRKFENLDIGACVSLDGSISDHGEWTAISGRNISVPTFQGKARVKFFDLTQGFGYAIAKTQHGKIDILLSQDLVEEAGWLPEKGQQLDVLAHMTPKRWQATSFMLVEKTGDDGFIDLIDETASEDGQAAEDAA